MKRTGVSLILLAFAVLVSSCGLYIQHQLNKDLEELSRDAESRGYLSNAAGWENHGRSLRAIYAKYGRSLDVFDELALSYITALASHRDRQTISEQEFQYLSRRMLADIDIEKQKLALQREAIRAQRDLAWQLAMEGFWANYQRSFRSPVTCFTMPLGGGYTSIRCY